jgi:cytochrome oxidase Cu insertion factor (SCO1/SenC/PrrC family)
MYPECKVFGKLTAKELEAHNHKMAGSNVYVYLENGFARPMNCSSDKADFHFSLPPGTYTLDAYAGETQSVRKSITVKPGQKELEVEPIDLPPVGLVLLEGKPAPELRGIEAWKNGGPVKLSELRGKPVILVFSHRWTDTFGMMKEMIPVYEKYKERGLCVIEIRVDSLRGDETEAKLAAVKPPFWKNQDVPIPIALVLETLTQSSTKAEGKNKDPNAPPSITNDYGISSFPCGVLIDRQGRIVGKYDPRGKPNDALLEKVLNEK